jgi:hypothetical protein
MLDSSPPGLLAGLSCKWLLWPVYRVTGFGPLELFVGEVKISVGPDFFFLILFDPVSNRVTREPARIEARWPQGFGAEDRLVKLPLVSSGRLLDSGKRQVVFEERVHNGTVYNAVVYHYFDIGADLKLTQVLAVEARTLDPFLRKVYLRQLSQVGPDELREDLFAVPIGGRGPRRRLGYSLLETKGPGAPFRLKKQRPAREEDRSRLLTGCETDPRGLRDALGAVDS